MTATLDTSTQRGQHVEQRLNEDVIAWLTTVRPSGQPDSVPVWFIWQDGRIIVYTPPHQTKMRNLAENPKVTLTLDNTNGGITVDEILHAQGGTSGKGGIINLSAANGDITLNQNLNAYGAGAGLARLVPQGDRLTAREVAYTRDDMRNHHGGLVVVDG